MSLVLDIETVPGDKKFSDEFVEKYLPQFKPKETVKKDKVKLAEAYAEHENKVVKAKSLDPDFGRIVCIGVINYDIKKDDIIEERVFFNQNEKKTIEDFWGYIKDNDIFFNTVTFNGLSFDLPFLFKRSMYNLVKIASPVQLKRFTYFPHFDLMMALNFWGFKDFKSLSFYTEALGLDYEKHDSSLIYGYWKQKEFEKITSHCMDHCRQTLAVFKRIKSYYPVG